MLSLCSLCRARMRISCIMTYVCDYTRLFFYMRSVFDSYLVVLIAIWLFEAGR